MKTLNFIDLFSGAGGLSEGFINAGFKPIAHVEVDKKACETLETRLIYHDLKKKNKLNHYYEYISGKVKREKFLKNFGTSEILNSVINMSIGGNNNKTIFHQIDKLSNDKIDLIVGGPPCQAYSLVGRSRDKNKMRNDPRNYLYKEYAKFLKKYKPSLFVFENVIGLITAENGSYFKNMQSYFKRIGYEIDYTIQKSENFGVLQKRRRIILIGWKKGSKSEEVHCSYNETKYLSYKRKTA